jgi:hypothetical protein
MTGAGLNQFGSASSPLIHLEAPKQVKRVWELALHGSTETSSSRKYQVGGIRRKPSLLSGFAAKQGCQDTFVFDEGRSAFPPILVSTLGSWIYVSVRVLAH